MALKELPCTRTARSDQLYDKVLVLSENRKSAFDILCSEDNKKMLNRAKSFNGASLRHFFFYISICTHFYLLNRFTTIIKLKEITPTLKTPH